MKKYQFVIGLIIMGASASVEKEFHSRIPEDLAIVTTRVPFHKISVQGMMDMIEALPEAASLLQGAQPDIMVVPNSFGSYMKGAEMKNTVQRVTGVPVYVTSECYLRVLRRLEAKNIGIISSFGEELSLLERLFFANNGIIVKETKNIEDFIEVGIQAVSEFDEELLMESLNEFVKEDVDAVIVNHPNFVMTEELAERVEKVIGCPILSALDVMLDTILTNHCRKEEFQNEYIEKFLR